MVYVRSANSTRHDRKLGTCSGNRIEAGQTEASRVRAPESGSPCLVLRRMREDRSCSEKREEGRKRQMHQDAGPSCCRFYEIEKAEQRFGSHSLGQGRSQPSNVTGASILESYTAVKLAWVSSAEPIHSLRGPNRCVRRSDRHARASGIPQRASAGHPEGNSAPGVACVGLIDRGGSDLSRIHRGTDLSFCPFAHVTTTVDIEARHR